MEEGEVQPLPHMGQTLTVSPQSLRTFSQSQHILYVEDQLSNIRLMSEVLKPYEQLHLVTHQDPFMGLYHARTQRPDIIILDIDLPGISGLDIVKILKKDVITAHIPVVALSANAMPHAVARGKQCGFDEYLTKPLNLQSLIGALNHFLAREVA